LLLYKSYYKGRKDGTNKMKDVYLLYKTAYNYRLEKGSSNPKEILEKAKKWGFKRPATPNNSDKCRNYCYWFNRMLKTMRLTLNQK